MVMEAESLEFVESEPDGDEETASADVLVDDLQVEWTEPDGDGVIEVTLRGNYVFMIHEGIDDTLQPAFTCGLFKTTKDDLHGALQLSLANVVRNGFKRKWNTLFPPEPIIRKPRISKSAELSIRERQMAEMFAAFEEDRDPDWEAAGVPAPDMQAILASAKKSMESK